MHCLTSLDDRLSSFTSNMGHVASLPNDHVDVCNPANLREEGFGWTSAMPLGCHVTNRRLSMVPHLCWASDSQPCNSSFDVNINSLARQPADFTKVEVRVLEGTTATGSGMIQQALQLGEFFVADGSAAGAWPDNVLAGVRYQAATDQPVACSMHESGGQSTGAPAGC